MRLGFINIYVYPGGMFEWLCLQDIYGSEHFPTTTEETDILMQKFYYDHDFQWVQRQIMQSDEYAHFD